MSRLFLIILCFYFSFPTLGDESTIQIRPEQRLMVKHIEREMGLEIWTEHNPLWYFERRYIGRNPVFLAQSPPKVYPPASMSVISYANQSNNDADFKEVALHAFNEGFTHYGVPEIERVDIYLQPKQYGELKGFEINFNATVHGLLADVKIFIGRKEDKGPVLLQLYTLEGKMSHLSEQIRRSWTNIRYL